MNTVTYDTAREKLAEIWNQIEESREEVILRRRGHEDLALIPAAELRSLKEAAHLLGSPARLAAQRSAPAAGACPLPRRGWNGGRDSGSAGEGGRAERVSRSPTPRQRGTPEPAVKVT